MLGMVALCVIAAVAAVGGLAATGLALSPFAGLGAAALLAAPALGMISLVSGLAAAILALRSPEG